MLFINSSCSFGSEVRIENNTKPHLKPHLQDMSWKEAKYYNFTDKCLNHIYELINNYSWGLPPGPCDLQTAHAGRKSPLRI